MSWDAVQAYREGHKAARTEKKPPTGDSVLDRARLLGWLSRAAESSPEHRAALAGCLRWFLEQHPSSPALIAFSRRGMDLLDPPDRADLLAFWLKCMEHDDAPPRALTIAAHFVEPQDWPKADELLARAARSTQEPRLLEVVATALYEHPARPITPDANERLERVAACLKTADRTHLVGLSLVAARMALAQQLWADAERWAEEAAAQAEGVLPVGCAETVGIAALAQGKHEKAGQWLTLPAEHAEGGRWKLRMTVRMTGMLHNRTWRNALIAALEHAPDTGRTAGVRKHLVSWKQRVETGTLPPRI